MEEQNNAPMPDNQTSGGQICGSNTPSPQLIPIDTSHKYTDVFSTDYIGPGNAHHVYVIKKKEGEQMLAVFFQNGPIKEAGVNGVMDENLIAIVIDRLEGFQSGRYACEENQQALNHLESALNALQDRTRKREARGVEGTHAV